MGEGDLGAMLDDLREAYHEAADGERTRDERDVALIRADRILLDVRVRLVPPAAASMQQKGA